MKISYCTLFDSNYLDKGLVTIRSLVEVSKALCSLYVLSMDDKCYDILCDLNLPYVVPIRLRDFENDEINRQLLEVKPFRSKGEYCWTCTASLLYYLLIRNKLECCTYIDADLCFYSDPQVLIDEMLTNEKSVLIVRHGFKNDYKYRFYVNHSGEYCVEFNTFINCPEAMQVLNDWRLDTIKHCSADEGGLGDQYYLSAWPSKYSCVHILNNEGAGVAPWNINKYRLVASKDRRITVRSSQSDFDIVFYHFQDICYVQKNAARINVFTRYWRVDSQLVKLLYTNYLESIDTEKIMLKDKYDVFNLIQAHPTRNNKGRSSLLKIIKKYFRRSFSENAFSIEALLLNRLSSKKDIIKFNSGL